MQITKCLAALLLVCAAVAPSAAEVGENHGSSARVIHTLTATTAWAEDGGASRLCNKVKLPEDVSSVACTVTAVVNISNPQSAVWDESTIALAWGTSWTQANEVFGTKSLCKPELAPGVLLPHCMMTASMPFEATEVNDTFCVLLENVGLEQDDADEMWQSISLSATCAVQPEGFIDGILWTDN